MTKPLRARIAAAIGATAAGLAVEAKIAGEERECEAWAEIPGLAHALERELSGEADKGEA